MIDIDFEQLYKIPLTAMRLSRVHPEVPRDKKWILQLLLLYGIYIFQYCAIAYDLFRALEIGDYADACRHGVVTVVFWIVTYQYFMLVVKQKNIMNIMKKMKNDFKKKLPDDEKSIVLEYANKGRNVCYKWFIAISITVAMFPIKLLTKELFLYIKGEFELQFIYPMTYIEVYKMQPLMYTIINILFLYFEFYGACTYASFVPLGPSFMLHACGQLEIIRKRASELYVNPSPEEIKIKLIEIIQHLQYIYEFVDNIKEIFVIIYEITLKGSAVILPIALYQVIEVTFLAHPKHSYAGGRIMDKASRGILLYTLSRKYLQSFHHGELSIEIITFLYSGTLFVSLPCYYSDMLMEKSEDVRQAIYCCGWESVYDRDSRTTMKLILLRALRPCSIRTIFRTMCLTALTGMFRQAYALLSLMNAAWG